MKLVAEEAMRSCGDKKGGAHRYSFRTLSDLQKAQQQMRAGWAGVVSGPEEG